MLGSARNPTAAAGSAGAPLPKPAPRPALRPSPPRPRRPAGPAARALAGAGLLLAALSAAPAWAAPAARSATELLTELAGRATPILLLLVVVGVVISTLPKVRGIEHAPRFIRRRVLNWVPLGMTYAFLYMARYNLEVAKGAFSSMRGANGEALMQNADFGVIFGAGTVVYGLSFVFNGPLTDRFGGKKAILTAAAGAGATNLLMGIGALQLRDHGVAYDFLSQNLVVLYALLYSLNMYFQSFGAVAVVKANAPWFHLKERGVFGAIFGVLISLGVYFAFDVGRMILELSSVPWVFGVPAALLALMLIVVTLIVENSPAEAGLPDLDTGDATEDGPRLGVVAVFQKMLSNPVVVTIALVEFCSGFMRQAIMQWFRTFARQTDAVLHLKSSYIYDNWGMLLCCAGILGGVVAGVISDRIFQSRRGPVAALLYGVMLIGALVLCVAYGLPAAVGALVLVMSTAVIGVHGMLSGTASMDFGGRRNVGVAVGIIDGFVYLGTGVMSFSYALALPAEQLAPDGSFTGPATDPANWIWWPALMVPISAIGFALTLRLWNARAKPGGGH